MRVPDDHPLAITFALRHADTVAAALDALAGRTDPVTTAGLLELVENERWAKPTLTALDRLTSTDTPLSADVLRRAFASRFAQVRLLACVRVREQKRAGFDAELNRVLTADDSWPNRRAALLALSERDEKWAILAAADDPHWRVRHALIRVLLGWDRAEVLERLRKTDPPPGSVAAPPEPTSPTRGEVGVVRTGPQAPPARTPITPPPPLWGRSVQPQVEPGGGSRVQRIHALIAYLRFSFDGTVPADWSRFTPPDRFAVCAFWDWDPAVLAATLNRMTKAERRTHVDAMPFLAGHDDERVWKPAVETIRDCGELRHYQGVVDWLADPRCGVSAAVERLLDGVDEETKDQLVSPSPLVGEGDQHRRPRHRHLLGRH